MSDHDTQKRSRVRFQDQVGSAMKEMGANEVELPPCPDEARMSSRVVRLFREQAITVAKRGREVVLITDCGEDAGALFEWLVELGREIEVFDIERLRDGKARYYIHQQFPQFNIAVDDAIREIERLRAEVVSKDKLLDQVYKSEKRLGKEIKRLKFLLDNSSDRNTQLLAESE